jgi:predicted transcriptional regulator
VKVMNAIITMTQRPTLATKGARPYRDELQVIRAVLQGMVSNGKPITWLHMVCLLESSSAFTNRYLRKMEDANLLKVSIEHWGRKYRKKYEITKKGLRVLEMLDAHSSMISTAAWINENVKNS